MRVSSTVPRMLIFLLVVFKQPQRGTLKKEPHQKVDVQGCIPVCSFTSAHAPFRSLVPLLGGCKRPQHKATRPTLATTLHNNSNIAPLLWQDERYVSPLLPEQTRKAFGHLLAAFHSHAHTHTHTDTCPACWEACLQYRILGKARCTIVPLPLLVALSHIDTLFHLYDLDMV